MQRVLRRLSPRAAFCGAPMNRRGAASRAQLVEPAHGRICQALDACQAAEERPLCAALPDRSRPPKRPSALLKRGYSATIPNTFFLTIEWREVVHRCHQRDMPFDVGDSPKRIGRKEQQARGLKTRARGKIQDHWRFERGSRRFARGRQEGAGAPTAPAEDRRRKRRARRSSWRRRPPAARFTRIWSDLPVRLRMLQ
jgi:hypothetical protein